MWDFMMKWHLLTTDSNFEKDWNDRLAKQNDFNLYQTFNWGAHRERSGWKAFRWARKNENNETISMVQVLAKILPFGIVAAWITGGPTGDTDIWVKDIVTLIKKETASKVLYIRMLNNKPSNEQDARKLIKNGWTRPRTKLRSGLSMLLDLNNEPEEIKKSFSKNWKHNLRRGEKRNLDISLWESPDAELIYDLYQSMQQLKGLDEQFTLEELKGIFKYMGEYIEVYRCVDETGRLIALRGCFILGEYGWDLFAAAASEARKIYATYVLFWTLMQRSKSLGVKTYDLMGIDPENNKGVYNFKKGTGSKEIKYLGEWEWASLPLLKFAINTAIKYKFL